MILADKNRIRQVLINLVSNALKFSNTKISVELFEMNKYKLDKNRHLFVGSPNQQEEIKEERMTFFNSLNCLPHLKLAAKLIRKNNLDPKEYIFICVSDDGDGISDDDQKKLFKLFGKIDKTHTKNKKGCGLGLTI
mmetsp:Transcript_10674/g.9389  ORF Transcript_10674/g.9389 Transcript_10674/m.9389 type:complete len:136 (+) Transcript_10674:83-490(+)